MAVRSVPLSLPRVRRLLLVPIWVLLPLLLFAACGGGEDDARKATLALDFQPNAVHAGIYAAQREEPGGMALEVRVPGASTDSLKLLAAGRADMAVVDIHDLGLARERGRDVVGVGALVQRPLAAVIAHSGEVRRPRDLEGRRVGVTGLASDEAVLRAVVESDGGDPERVDTVTTGFAAVPSLIAGRVDAVVSFWNVEGVALRRRGVRTREFRVDEFGAPRYPELVLAVERETLDERRALVSDLPRRAGRRNPLGTQEPRGCRRRSGASFRSRRAADPRSVERGGPRAAPSAAARPASTRGLGRVRPALRNSRREARCGPRFALPR